jgi:hypothetical protein
MQFVNSDVNFIFIPVIMLTPTPIMAYRFLRPRLDLLPPGFPSHCHPVLFFPVLAGRSLTNYPLILRLRRVLLSHPSLFYFSPINYACHWHSRSSDPRLCAWRKWPCLHCELHLSLSMSYLVSFPNPRITLICSSGSRMPRPFSLMTRVLCM